MPLFSPHLQGFLRISVFSSLGIVFIWLDLLDELRLGDFLPAVFLLPPLVWFAWWLGLCRLTVPLCCVASPVSWFSFLPLSCFPCFGGAYLAVAFCERIHRRRFFLRPSIPENAFIFTFRLDGHLGNHLSKLQHHLLNSSAAFEGVMLFWFLIFVRELFVFPFTNA